MATINYDDVFRLLNEWISIVEVANPEHHIREHAKVIINNIIAELQKSLNERDCEEVDFLMMELANIKGISQYVKDSRNLVMEVCCNK
jgi:hypothetical protein